jgi:hypothetical protein
MKFGRVLAAEIGRRAWLRKHHAARQFNQTQFNSTFARMLLLVICMARSMRMCWVGRFESSIEPFMWQKSSAIHPSCSLTTLLSGASIVTKSSISNT